MKANGKIILNMEKEGMSGLMALNTKESTIRVRDKEKESWFTLMDKLMKVNGLKDANKGRVNSGQTNKIFLDIGRRED